MWTHLLGGNLHLSITMTCLSTLAAFGKTNLLVGSSVELFAPIVGECEGQVRNRLWSWPLAYRFFLIAMMPLWTATMGRLIFSDGVIVIPFHKITTLGAGLVIPLVVSTCWKLSLCSLLELAGSRAVLFFGNNLESNDLRLDWPADPSLPAQDRERVGQMSETFFGRHPFGHCCFRDLRQSLHVPTDGLEGMRRRGNAE